MENRDKQNPETGQESDISKAQSQQQPPAAQSSQQQFAQGGQPQSGEQGNEPESGQSKTPGQPDEGLQGDTTTRQATDVEGSSLQSEETGEAGSGFVGSKGSEDSSSELIDEQDFDKDGQGARGDGE